MTFKAPKLSKTLLLLIAGMVLGFSVPMIILIIRYNGHQMARFSQVALLIGEALIPLPIILWSLRHKQSLKATFQLRKPRGLYFLFSILAGIGLIIISDELERLIGIIFPVPDQLAGLEQLLTISDWPSAFLIITGIAIVGPLAEELVFRGFLQQSLAENLQSITQAVVYTALAFTIIHFNIYWSLNIFIIGFFLSFITYKCNSIFPGFVVHSLNNTLALVFIHFEDELNGVYLVKGHVHPLIIITGLFVLGFSMVKLTGQKKLSRNKRR